MQGLYNSVSFRCCVFEHDSAVFEYNSACLNTILRVVKTILQTAISLSLLRDPLRWAWRTLQVAWGKLGERAAGLSASRALSGLALGYTEVFEILTCSGEIVFFILGKWLCGRWIEMQFFWVARVCWFFFNLVESLPLSL